jgi:hypothetical protein
MTRGDARSDQARKAGTSSRRERTLARRVGGKNCAFQTRTTGSTPVHSSGSSDVIEQAQGWVVKRLLDNVEVT